MDAPDLTALSELSDDDYADILTANVNPKTRDQQVWQAVTSEENIHRTRDILARVHQRAANTLRRRKTEREAFHQECRKRGAAGKQEWFETRSEYEDWRRKAAYFHQAVQGALAELGKLHRDMNRGNSRAMSNEARETLRKLSIAVQRHQAVHAKAGSIAGQEDYELWQHLDRLTVPCGPDQEPTTLRAMLDFYWTDVDVVTGQQEERAAAERTMRQAPGGRAAQFSGVPRARHVGGEKPLSG